MEEEEEGVGAKVNCGGAWSSSSSESPQIQAEGGLRQELPSSF